MTAAFIGVLFGIIFLLICLLTIDHARAKAQDSDIEALESKLELAQMKIREMEREQRRERANPR